LFADTVMQGYPLGVRSWGAKMRVLAISIACLLFLPCATGLMQARAQSMAVEPCAGFTLDSCMDACDKKLGIANPLKLQCVKICRDGKADCAAGRTPSRNPYLTDEEPAPSKPSSSSPTATLTAPADPVSPVKPVPDDQSRSSFHVSDNYDLDGADLRTVKNTDRDKCISACKDEPRCQAFSFDKWNRYCFLKSTISARRLDPRSISGLRENAPAPPTAGESEQMERYRGKLFPGTGYKTLSRTSFETCEATCKQDHSCVAYTVEKAQQLCRLFNTTGEYFPNIQADSGIKRQPPP
jgi:hypothetical protein